MATTKTSTKAGTSTATDQTQLLDRFQKAADDFADVLAIAVGYFPAGEEVAGHRWAAAFSGPLPQFPYRCDGDRHGRQNSPWRYLIVRHHSVRADDLKSATRRLVRLAEDRQRFAGGQWEPHGMADFLDALRPPATSAEWQAFSQSSATGGGYIMRATPPPLPAGSKVEGYPTAPARHRFAIVPNPFEVAMRGFVSVDEVERPTPDRSATAVAMLTLKSKPSIQRIADAIGVNRQDLYQKPEFENFRKAREALKRKKALMVPRGTKTAHGDMEATAPEGD